MSTVLYKHAIGVIAGLGPAAGAYFYQCLVQAAPAASDQDHPEVVLISDPGIPSRLRHLAGEGSDPTAALCRVARRLADAGCGVLVLTSITTHAYYDAVAAAVGVPVINACEAVAATVADSGIQTCALAVTTPARSLGLLDSALRHAGVVPRYPNAGIQSIVDSAVAAMKGGRSLAEAGSVLRQALERDWAQTCDGILVGCTDIAPLIPHLTVGVFDVTRILAGVALQAAR